MNQTFNANQFSLRGHFYAPAAAAGRLSLPPAINERVFLDDFFLFMPKNLVPAGWLCDKMFFNLTEDKEVQP